MRKHELRPARARSTGLGVVELQVKRAQPAQIVEGARKPAPPVPNITQLVYQIYNRLKREFEIGSERWGGF